MSGAFEMAIAVEPADIDGLGHVNNVVYLRWVQDIAIAHWRAVASAADQEKFLWIVVRHEIDYKQPARLGDVILAKTWVGAATRIKFERHTEMLRAQRLACCWRRRGRYGARSMRTRASWWVWAPK